ncbi:hypothetical protein K456DRAFT_1849272 [Colletotrichum gloeosporioides 23]|nr:hypothetical protein K456DRAFT_1849272 [Colletotrichum gloeosporioides 23]
MSFKVRAAVLQDMDMVHAIYSHYILNTPTDMHHVPPSLTSFIAEYEDLSSRNLPYLVATECILGFIHAFPFRGYKVGYSHTAELAVICHPGAIKQGVGSALMKEFLRSLEEGGAIQQILAFMTVLEDPEEDNRVRSFYEKWGFKEVGKLVDVGQKFGRR